MHQPWNRFHHMFVYVSGFLAPIFADDHLKFS